MIDFNPPPPLPGLGPPVSRTMNDRKEMNAAMAYDAFRQGKTIEAAVAAYVFYSVWISANGVALEDRQSHATICALKAAKDLKKIAKPDRKEIKIEHLCPPKIDCIAELGLLVCCPEFEVHIEHIYEKSRLSNDKLIKTVSIIFHQVWQALKNLSIHSRGLLAARAAIMAVDRDAVIMASWYDSSSRMLN